ncbi:MAG: MotA/TolQ/ExbB proton channel family protein [Planctomycetota bacterium]
MNMHAGFSTGSSRRIWFSWFGGTLIVIAMLAGAWLTKNSQLFLYSVLGVIAGFFLVTLVRSFMDVSFLDKETKLASEQVQQLAQINDVGQFIQTAKPSLFRNHIASLYTIFKSHPEIQQDSLVEVTHARLIARNKLVELFASVLVTLGLIGTIIGLIDSTAGLGDAMTSMFGDSDGEQSDEILGSAMITTFGGLKTAFYTTLLGSLFGGVVLRLLTNVVDAAILRYMAHLAELTEVNVLPALRRMASTLQAQGYYSNLD